MIQAYEYGIKIKDATPEHWDQFFRYAFMLTSLKAENIPTDEQTTAIIHILIQWFSENTIQELRIAFEMAVAGKLDVDATSFQNFSVQYVTSIMNAYRRWASKVITPKYSSATPTKNEINYGGLVEKHYQRFLFGYGNYTEYTVEMFDQLVKDNMIVVEDSMDITDNDKRKYIYKFFKIAKGMNKKVLYVRID